MAGLRVPGYDVVELLGFGSGGEVWLAREQATGSPVALKRLHAHADIAARDRLRREAAVLAGIDHPHVVRLRSVVGAGESLVLVLDLAAGGSLARLLATRGRLTAGEVVTVAVPLAQALAAIHAQGLVHGDITPANVLFTADGRPVLSDLGVARLLGAPHSDVGGTPGYLDPAVLAGGETGPAADVHGLAATCLAALAGHPAYDESGCRAALPEGDALLTAALESALARDPADRPTAGELASVVYAAERAQPVQLDGAHPYAATVVAAVTGVGTGAAVPAVTRRVVRASAATAEPSPPGRRDPLRPRGVHRAGATRVATTPSRRARTGRRALVALLSVLALAMVVGGVLEARAGAGPRPAVGQLSPAEVGRPVAAADAAPATWTATLTALDMARSRAFATTDRGLLSEVYAPGAPALRRDLVVLGRLVGAGLRARGLRLVPVAVAIASGEGRADVAPARRVRLDVEDVMPAYQIVDDNGSVIERRPGRGRVRWTVTLERAGDRWVVYDVERA